MSDLSPPQEIYYLFGRRGKTIYFSFKVTLTSTSFVSFHTVIIRLYLLLQTICRWKVEIPFSESGWFCVYVCALVFAKKKLLFWDDICGNRIPEDTVMNPIYIRNTESRVLISLCHMTVKTIYNSNGDDRAHPRESSIIGLFICYHCPRMLLITTDESWRWSRIWTVWCIYACDIPLYA